MFITNPPHLLNYKTNIATENRIGAFVCSKSFQMAEVCHGIKRVNCINCQRAMTRKAVAIKWTPWFDEAVVLMVVVVVMMVLMAYILCNSTIVLGY